MDKIKSIAGYINEKGQLVYLSNEGISTTVAGAKKFDDWGDARNEIFNTNNNVHLGWFVFLVNEETGNCTVRNHICYDTIELPDA